MDNINVKKISLSRNFAFPTKYKKEQGKFENKIDTNILNNIIKHLEVNENNPNMWISFDKAMKNIRRDILN